MKRKTTLRTAVRTLAVAGLSLAAMTGISQAAIITLDWSAIITETGGNSGITVGDKITGSLSFDSDSPVIIDSGSVVRYATNHTVSYVMGARSGSITNMTMAISNNSSGADRIQSFEQFSQTPVYTGDTIDGKSPFVIYVTFEDTSQSVFSSTALPTSLNAADWTFGTGYGAILFGFGGRTDTIRFNNTSFTAEVSAVPVPAGLPLLVTGLGAVAWMRRRKNAA